MEPVRVRDIGVLDKHIHPGRGLGRRAHVRTYGGGRRCPCGTVLSRYNPAGVCACCSHTPS